jgi:hypothetical protein
MPIGDLHSEADLLAFMDQNRKPATSPLSGLFTWGTGVPSAAPKAARAMYLRLDGGANTTLYIWAGAAWAAK